ncbi:MAG: hypothetical protein GYB31_06290 [Bacteroidetes bacterium]|nr:hypothetical protein [Bacteroidota bacterium]
MKILLFPLYHLLRTIVRISLRIFYRRSVILNRKALSTPGPLFILSNHPSTVMDPFNVVARSRRMVYFLANASLFKHPVADRILSTLYCIKVERYEDVNNRPLNNEQAFAQSIKFLKNGGCLYVAPEGTSKVERHLRKVKTGTARIALAAEAAHGFNLGIKILPAGIIYSNPRYFREQALVKAGELIRVADFKDLYLKDSREAVKALTLKIRAGLSANMIDADTPRQDEALAAWEMLTQTENPLPWKKKGLRSLEQLKAIKTGAFSTETLSRMQIYFQGISRNGLSDESLAGKRGMTARILFLLTGLPLAIFGFLNHLLPCGIPWLINRKLNIWPCYEATYKYISGLIFFPLFYYLQIRLASQWIDWWIYALSLPISGLFTDFYRRELGRWQEERRWKNYRRDYPASAQRLLDLRISLREQLF